MMFVRESRASLSVLDDTSPTTVASRSRFLVLALRLWLSQLSILHRQIALSSSLMLVLSRRLLLSVANVRSFTTPLGVT